MINIFPTTILLLLIMDPLGNLPIFISILKNLQPQRRNIILLREMFIALVIMLLFLFEGEHILQLLNVRTEAVSITGGIILCFIATQMVFPTSNHNHINGLSLDEEPFCIPLAIPLVAGPSLLATLMLLSHEYSTKITHLLCALLLAWLSTSVILLLSNFFLRLIGDKGVHVMERLMGLILIMISVQMFLDGVQSYIIV